MRVGIYSKKFCFYELFILTIMNGIFWRDAHVMPVETAVGGELQHATNGGGTSLDGLCCSSVYNEIL